MNHRRLGALLGITLAAGAVTWWAASARPDATEEETLKDGLTRLFDVMGAVRNSYVDSVGTGTLTDAAIRGMLQTLDPYSEYLTADQAEELSTRAHGAYGGVGLSIAITEHTATVIAPVEGSPGWRAGIRGGDRIVAIDRESIRGLSLDAVSKRMRGDPGTRVTLTVERPGVEGSFEFALAREVIELKSVPYAALLPGGVGYIRLSGFSEHSGEEIDAALKRIDAGKPQGLILDLRDNPGGLLSSAVQIADEFAPAGKRIVFTRGQVSRQNRDYFSSSDRASERSRVPIVVLVNRWSASASEIVAGALQDLDLAVVAGETSYGKGLVQETFPLSASARPGPLLKLTTAKYYTPSGRCIQKDEHLAGGALAEHETSRPVFHTESGRVVYGGGGIAPDFDLSERLLPRAAADLDRRGTFFEFAIQYAAKHASPPPTYTVGQDLRSEFAEFLQAKRIPADRDSLATAQWAVDLLLSRELARRYGGDEAAYRVSVDADSEIQEAANLIHRAGTLPKLLALASETHRSKKDVIGSDPVR